MMDIGETDEATARRYFENGGCPQERCRGHAFALTQRIDALAAENADYDNQLEERFMELQRAEARIRELEAQVESLQNKWASRPLSSKDQGRRIVELEAALRDLVDYTDITKHVDADAITERVKRARVVLGLTAETKGEQT